MRVVQINGQMYMEGKDPFDIEYVTDIKDVKLSKCGRNDTKYFAYVNGTHGVDNRGSCIVILEKEYNRLKKIYMGLNEKTGVEIKKEPVDNNMEHLEV